MWMLGGVSVQGIGAMSMLGGVRVQEGQRNVDAGWSESAEDQSNVMLVGVRVQGVSAMSMLGGVRVQRIKAMLCWLE